MIQRSLVLSAVAAVLLVLGGCVAKSDYLQKQAEAAALSRDVERQITENRELRETIDGLREKVNALTIGQEKLSAERDDLNSRLQALKEETSNAGKTIKAQRTRIAELEGDKQMLGESIALLKSSKEKEVKTVSTTYEDLLSEMKGEIEQGQIAITELQGKLTVDVLDKILFDSGQAEIKPEGLAVLKRVVDILMTVSDKLIRIEGHTDNVPIAGALAKKYPTNWELSAARALNVTRYLEREGIDPAVLSAAAFGEYQPVADNDTPEGRAKNRRIAITLLPLK
jgi:chemotaxis protein MotB